MADRIPNSTDAIARPSLESWFEIKRATTIATDGLAIRSRNGVDMMSSPLIRERWLRTPESDNIAYLLLASPRAKMLAT